MEMEGSKSHEEGAELKCNLNASANVESFLKLRLDVALRWKGPGPP